MEQEQKPENNGTQSTNSQPAGGENDPNSLSFFSQVRAMFSALLHKGFAEGFKEIEEKKQETLFFLIVAGFAAFFISFSFITHFFLSNYLEKYGDIAILSIGFFISVAFMLAGLKLTRRSEKGSDMGGVLFSIALIFNIILFFYFFSFEEIKPGIQILLFLLNSILGFAYSYFFRAKNVLFTAFVPTSVALLYTDSFSALPYFAILWGLSALSLVLSFRIVWRDFRFWVLLLPLVIIVGEIQISNYELHFGFLIVFHAFAYLNLIFSFLEKNEESIITFREKPKRSDVALYVISFGFLLYSIFIAFQGDENHWGLGLSYLLNIVPFAIVLSQHEKLGKALTNLLWGAATALLSLSLFVFFSQQPEVLTILGILVSLALIWSSFYFKIGYIRQIGYFIFVLTFGIIAPNFTEIVEQWEELFLTKGYYYFAFSGLSLWAIIYIFENFREKNKQYEISLTKVLREFLSLWILIFYIITVWKLTNWYVALILSLPGIFFLVYRGKINQLPFTKVIGLVGFAVVIGLLGTIVYYDLLVYEKSFPNKGFFSLFLIGLYILAMKFWVRASDSVYLVGEKFLISSRKLPEEDEDDELEDWQKDGKKEKQSILSQSIPFLQFLLPLWLAAASVILSFWISGEWASVGLLLPAFVLMYFGVTEQYKPSFWIGFFLFNALIFYSLYTAFFSPEVAMQIWLLFVAGVYTALFWASYTFLIKRRQAYGFKGIRDTETGLKTSKNPFITPYNKLRGAYTATQSLRFGKKAVKTSLSEKSKAKEIHLRFAVVLAVWFAVWANYTSFSLWHNWGYNAAIVPLFALMAWGAKRGSGVAEILGWAHLAVFGAGFITSLEMAGWSPRLSAQPAFGKVLILEIYFTLWVLKFFYQKVLNEKKGYKITVFLHRFALAVLPFGIAFMIYRRLNVFFPYAPWVSLLVIFIITEITKLRFFLREFYFWLVLASASVVFFNDVYALLFGLATIWGIVLYKRGLRRRIKGKIEYRFVPAYAYYMVAVAIFVAFRQIPNTGYAGGMLLAASYLLLLVLFRKKIRAVRISYLIPYRAAYLLIGGAVLLFAFDSVAFAQIEASPYKLFTLIFLPVSLYILHEILYKDQKYPGKNLKRWRAEILLTHLIYVATYVAFLKYFYAGFYRLPLSFAFFIHGIVILIKTISPKLKMLKILPYFFFIGALLKMVVFDIRNFALIQIVFAFMFLGVIFLVGAGIFMQKKAAFEKKNKGKT